MVGAKKKGSSKIVLYSSEKCVKALKATDSDNTASKGDGESHWYRVKGKAFGFAPSEVIDLKAKGADSCDKSCDGD